MSLHFAEGDMLADENLERFDAIGHGVNCQGFMGAGIAFQIARKWPALNEDYIKVCRQTPLLLVPGQVFGWRTDQGFYIYNIATQFYPGANARYEWLTAGLQRMMSSAGARGFSSIALPRIGSGIGGLNQTMVESIIHGFTLAFPGVDVTIFDYKESEVA